MNRVGAAIAVVIAVLAWGVRDVPGETQKKSRPIDPATPELVLHYDFYGVEDGRVSDASGRKHDGKLVGGVIVLGRRRPAVAFEGQGAITVTENMEALDFTSRTLSVGARCKPASADGVVVSVGDQTNGLSLYLQNGIPHFAVRADGKLTTVAGTESVVIDQWVHLYGVIDAKGHVLLVSNGWPAATAKGTPLASSPTEPLCVGADFGVPVGDYQGPLHWHGQIESVRLYWGVIERATHGDELSDWAELPGCGCRK
jgi:hypothetical protein